MPPKVFLSHGSLFRNWKFKISAVNSVSASAIPIYIMRHSKESLTATFCYKYELFSHPDQHPKFCTLNYGISGFTKVFYFPDGRNSVGYWEKNPFLWNQWFQGYITLFWISQVVLVVFQVVTGEAHYAKASLLVQYRLICSKPHRVAIGQTSVKISESRILTSSRFWKPPAVFTSWTWEGGWPEQLLQAPSNKCFILLVTGSPQEFLSHILPGN